MIYVFHPSGFCFVFIVYRLVRTPRATREQYVVWGIHPRKGSFEDFQWIRRARRFGPRYPG